MVDYVVYSTKGEPSTERKIVRILLDRAEVSRYQIEQGLTLYQEKELKEVKRAL